MTRAQKLLLGLAALTLPTAYAAARMCVAHDGASGWAWPVLWGGVATSLALVAACAWFDPA